MAEPRGFDWDTANVAHIARHGVEPAQVEYALSKKQIPKFNSEAQEARWWDTQGGRIARDIEAAVGAGEDLTAQPAALLRVSAAAKNITIRLPLEDLEKARALARRRGLRYQTYVKMLLHQALAADERQLL